MKKANKKFSSIFSILLILAALASAFTMMGCEKDDGKPPAPETKNMGTYSNVWDGQKGNSSWSGEWIWDKNAPGPSGVYKTGAYKRNVKLYGTTTITRTTYSTGYKLSFSGTPTTVTVYCKTLKSDGLPLSRIYYRSGNSWIYPRAAYVNESGDLVLSMIQNLI